MGGPDSLSPEARRFAFALSRQGRHERWAGNRFRPDKSRIGVKCA